MTQVDFFLRNWQELKKMFVRPRNEFAVKASRTMKKTASIFTKTTNTEISRDKLGHLDSG